MNRRTAIAALAWTALLQDAFSEVTSERVRITGNGRQEYFLIRDAGAEPPDAGAKLLLVLPGGDGSAAFNPFVTNIARHAVGRGYIVAQLISVQWSPDQSIVWPTSTSAVEGMEFTTPEFISAVIEDLEKAHEVELDPEHIYSLSWSSSGPAAYAASLEVDRLKGSFVAMSVFKRRELRDIGAAEGHRYYLYHSPADKVCPIALAKQASESLSEAGAEVELETYDGGHGWHGDIFGAIRRGMAWLEER